MKVQVLIVLASFFRFSAVVCSAQTQTVTISIEFMKFKLLRKLWLLFIVVSDDSFLKGLSHDIATLM